MTKSKKDDYAVFFDGEFAEFVASVQEGIKLAQEEISVNALEDVDVEIFQLVKSGKFKTTFVEKK